MSALWEPGSHFFPTERLDEFLVWAWGERASDVVFQEGAPALIEIDGRVRLATGAALDGVVLGEIAERLYEGSAVGSLLSGGAVDCSHAVALERGRDIRFRCNLSPVQVRNGFAINATLRLLPGKPPALEELGVEEAVSSALLDCVGLNLVTGVPGSGKSTLLAASTRRLLERGAGRIHSYEAPIEFTFDGIGLEHGSLMSSSEIPRHFKTFADGLRSSLRRRPVAVLVGEARDRETVEAALAAADFGIAVYSTTHTIGVANTVRRMLAEFPEEQREERGAALVDVLHAVVTQLLVANPEGGRTAIREWLVFDGALKTELLDMPRLAWPQRIGAALAATGNGLVRHAEAAAAEGRIGARDLARIRASHGLRGSAAS